MFSGGESVIAVLIHAMIYFLEKEMLGLGQLLRLEAIGLGLEAIAFETDAMWNSSCPS